MPSVTFEWTGQCPDPEARERLIPRLCLLDRPAEASAGHRFSRAFVRPVPISSGIASDAASFLREASESGLTTGVYPGPFGQAITVPRSLEVCGVSIPLCGSGTGGLNGRLRLAFLESPDWPFLDGRLVQIEGSGAEPLLGPPTMTIEHHLEDWFCLLLCWMKHFFIPDLRWRGRAEMQGSDEFLDVMAGVELALGKERAECASLESVLATYAQHAEHWRRAARGQGELSLIAE